MSIQLQFRKKKFSRCKFDIYPSADFQEIIDTLEELEFINLNASKDHIIYALLELISNSIRAHKEQARMQSIELTLQYNEGGLEIQIKDTGGGFDLSRLPYDFQTPVQQLDINSKSFQNYREENGYQRFGMGLIIARKTFDHFSINFHNNHEEFSQWNPQICKGTLFRLFSAYKNQEIELTEPGVSNGL
jgi:anti-sigma regulatory factor (Ser/Thr protein kinase)